MSVLYEPTTPAECSCGGEPGWDCVDACRAQAVRRVNAIMALGTTSVVALRTLADEMHAAASQLQRKAFE